MSSGHSQRLHEAFTKQAAAFEDHNVNHVFTHDARWLFALLECRADDLLLDVAAGTGHAARELAGRVRAAVAVDVTPAMLAAGSSAARQQGIENIVFQLGDAVKLPFLDGSFDVVVSRFALHHMEQPQRALAEMVRCLRPGGRIAIADMVASDDPTLASAQNCLEQARDASHTGMLSVVELVSAFERLGLSDIVSEAREIARPLEPWLDQAQTDPAVAKEIRRELQAEIDSGAETGMRPCMRDGQLWFCQSWAVVIGRYQAGTIVV
jgi:ubiquinone/menaquinone biosynthesis C-methylase UbiE